MISEIRIWRNSLGLQILSCTTHLLQRTNQIKTSLMPSLQKCQLFDELPTCLQNMFYIVVCVCTHIAGFIHFDNHKIQGLSQTPLYFDPTTVKYSTIQASFLHLAIFPPIPLYKQLHNTNNTVQASCLTDMYRTRFCTRILWRVFEHSQQIRHKMCKLPQNLTFSPWNKF